MCAVGDTVIYKAPTDVQAGDSRILARVGPGTESAAIVTGVNGDIANLRVFPDQQEDFSIRGITEAGDPVMGSYVAASTPTGETSSARSSKTPTPPTPASQAPNPPSSRRV